MHSSTNNICAVTIVCDFARDTPYSRLRYTYMPVKLLCAQCCIKRGVWVPYIAPYCLVNPIFNYVACSWHLFNIGLTISDIRTFCTQQLLLITSIVGWFENLGFQLLTLRPRARRDVESFEFGKNRTPPLPFWFFPKCKRSPNERVKCLFGVYVKSLIFKKTLHPPDKVQIFASM